MINTTYLSVLTLNVNGLNSLLKRHRMRSLIKSKTQPFVVYKKHISLTKVNIFSVKG
jgi:hypothetical protein